MFVEKKYAIKQCSVDGYECEVEEGEEWVKSGAAKTWNQKNNNKLVDSKSKLLKLYAFPTLQTLLFTSVRFAVEFYVMS